MFYRAYAYRNLIDVRTSAQVEFMNYRKPDGSLLRGFKYEYNSLGNISNIYKSNATGTDSAATWTYTYDKLGQLTFAADNHLGYNYSYTYDTAGNIKSMAAMPMGSQSQVIKTFRYGNASWPDLLTNVTVRVDNGSTVTKSITYPTNSDGTVCAGTPLTYYNGKDYNFTWGKGTQLTGTTMGDTEISYTYDMAGVRSSKTVNGVTHYYTTLSGLVMQESWGNKTLYFIYDDNNQPYALIFKNGGAITPYYYMLNQQGDVIAIVDSTNGSAFVEYQYDPWGAVTVYDNSGIGLGAVNPLRYRGYYYDTETGFYYLQSRYYDPAIGRFISSDNQFSVGDMIGTNLFAYCGNNPVNYVDPSGHFLREIGAAFVHALQQASAMFAVAGAVSQIDSPIPGPADVVAGILIVGTTLICGGTAIYDTLVAPASKQSSSLPGSQDKAIAIPAPPHNQAYFPVNPYDFNPVGLTRQEYVKPGSGKNGGIIKWEIPGTHVAIFEWNEDFTYGPHYHTMLIEWDGKHFGPHYLPGSEVPEPWNTIYFWK